MVEEMIVEFDFYAKIVLIIGVMAGAYFAFEYLFPTKKSLSQSALKPAQNFNSEDGENLSEKQTNYLEPVKKISDYELGKSEAPRFQHACMYNYWNTYIASYYYHIKLQEKWNAKYFEVMRHLMLYIEKFIDKNHASTSCTSGRILSTQSRLNSDYECNQMMMDGSLEFYASIDLIEHTFNVVKMALRETTQHDQPYMWSGRIGPIIIAALAHDIGKFEKQKTPKEKRTHEVVSVEIFRNIANGLLPNETLEKIAIAITEHHHKIDRYDSNIYRFLLQHAEINARQKEVKESLEKNPNGAVKTIQEYSLKIDQTKELLKVESVHLLSEIDRYYQFMVFDKKHHQYVFIFNELLKKIAQKNNIDSVLYLSAIKKLSEEGIVGWIDFNRYNTYKRTLKYHDGARNMAELIPIKYEKLGFTTDEILKKFMKYEMPKLC